MHDTTCTPALADIAGLRDALAEAGFDPTQLAPTLPIEVSVDHSLAVDLYADHAAAKRNLSNEIARNAERYAFMKWASLNMTGVHVNPPGTGIMHTLNLEQLATLLVVDDDGLAHPDMVLGTDSHTPMINGIGVLGWGVATLHADARAVVANMAPEYGASTGFFPVDAQSVAYLQRTGRDPNLTDRIAPVFKHMGLWFDPNAQPQFNRTLMIDLSDIGPRIAGPRRPQDCGPPSAASQRVEAAIGRKLIPPRTGADDIPDGAVGVAAITSCTNTSDPRLLIAAGLLAQKAHLLGLRPPHWVKTSLAPGSPSARSYLKRAGLAADLSAVGFDIVGFGCTTCIGNSGPLPPVVEQALHDGKAISAVLSGNRNFPGRVHPKLDLAYLASPP